MNIIEMRVSDLKAYENNPRNNVDAVDKVAASIEEFGFKVPIIIDKDNIIIAGHTRLLAAKSLGLEKVPCIIADDLTPDQVKAFRLADNKVAEYSTWDFQKLNIELEELKDFEMADFGFYSVGNADDFSSIFDDEPQTEKSEKSESEDSGDEGEGQEKVLTVVVRVDSEQEAEDVVEILNENGWDSEVMYQ